VKGHCHHLGAPSSSSPGRHDSKGGGSPGRAAPPTHSSRPIVRPDGIGLLAPRRLGAASIPVCQVWLLGPVSEPARSSAVVVTGICQGEARGRRLLPGLLTGSSPRYQKGRQRHAHRSHRPGQKHRRPGQPGPRTGPGPDGTLKAAQIPSPTRTWVNSCQSGSSLMFRMAAGSRWLNATAHGPWASRSCPSSTAWASGPTRWPSAAAPRRRPASARPISREQLLGRVGDLLQGWSWTVG
jgi:hypothetical protein